MNKQMILAVGLGLGLGLTQVVFADDSMPNTNSAPSATMPAAPASNNTMPTNNPSTDDNTMPTTNTDTNPNPSDDMNKSTSAPQPVDQ